MTERTESGRLTEEFLNRLAENKEEVPEILLHLALLQKNLINEVPEPTEKEIHGLIDSIREKLGGLEAGVENPEVSWWVELGDAYLQDGDEDRAAANFQAALERDPNRAEAFAGMGLLYIRNRAYQMAKTALERAVELGPLEPSLAGTRNNLAIVYCYFGDFERAADELDAAGNLGFPIDPSFREKLAKEIIGQRQAHQEEPS